MYDARDTDELDNETSAARWIPNGQQTNILNQLLVLSRKRSID